MDYLAWMLLGIGGLQALILALILLRIVHMSESVDDWRILMRAPATPVQPSVPVFMPPVAEPVSAGLPVELLRRVNGEWQHHSMRPEGHFDIATALQTPGLAISRNGVIEEGQQ